MLKIWNRKGAEVTSIQADTNRINDLDILVFTEDEVEDSADFYQTSWESLVLKEEWEKEHKKKLLARKSQLITDVLTVTASDNGKISFFRPVVVRDFTFNNF